MLGGLLFIDKDLKEEGGYLYLYLVVVYGMFGF